MVEGYGKINIVVYSLLNGPEVTKSLLEMSYKGYPAALLASAYLAMSFLYKFGPIMNKGGGSTLSIIYIASELPSPGTREVYQPSRPSLSPAYAFSSTGPGLPTIVGTSGLGPHTEANGAGSMAIHRMQWFQPLAVANWPIASTSIPVGP